MNGAWDGKQPEPKPGLFWNGRSWEIRVPLTNRRAAIAVCQMLTEYGAGGGALTLGRIIGDLISAECDRIREKQMLFQHERDVERIAGKWAERAARYNDALIRIERGDRGSEKWEL